MAARNRRDSNTLQLTGLVGMCVLGSACSSWGEIAGSGQPTATEACAPFVLSPIGASALSVPTGSSQPLAVALIDACDQPVANATIGFTVSGDPADSVLIAAEAVSAADGTASVLLQAGALASLFSVEAESNQASAKVVFTIEVQDPCADHCANQLADCGETGVDCGGGCAACPGPALADPKVYQTHDEGQPCSPPAAVDCTLRDMAYVTSEYGTSVNRASDASGTAAVYRIVGMSEQVGPASIDVFVVDSTGAPVVGVPVALYWPDAPETARPDEWYPVKVTTVTDGSGRAGFAVAGSAFIHACGAGGPHAIWVSQPGAEANTSVPSDLVDKVGWVPGTNHRHLDLMFQRIEPPPANPPVDAMRCPL